MKSTLRYPLSGLALGVVALAGCDGSNNGNLLGPSPVAGVCSTAISLALDDGSILRVNAQAPGTALSKLAATGLDAAAGSFRLDSNPNNGGLTALDDKGNLYSVASATATLTKINTASNTLPGTAIGGFDIDFNPILNPERIRATYDGTGNVRFKLSDGTVAGTDTAVAYVSTDANAGATPHLTGVAYTNSGRNNGTPPASTTLFAIDTAGGVGAGKADRLVQIGVANATTATLAADGPNGGKLTTIGNLGIDLFQAPLDIGCSPEIGFTAGVTSSGGDAQLFKVDLASGAATLIGSLPTKLAVIGLAVDK